MSAPTAGTVGLRMLLPAWACLSWALCLFQVSLLQSQLARDQQHWQNYTERCARTSQELSDLHQELSCYAQGAQSCCSGSRDSKLHRSLKLNLAVTSLGHQSLERQAWRRQVQLFSSPEDLCPAQKPVPVNWGTKILPRTQTNTLKDEGKKYLPKLFQAFGS